MTSHPDCKNQPTILLKETDGQKRKTLSRTSRTVITDLFGTHIDTRRSEFIFITLDYSTPRLFFKIAETHLFVDLTDYPESKFWHAVIVIVTVIEQYR